MISEVSIRFGRNSARRTSRRGFTLVELLVCIGLLLMLMAILLPAARRSMESARQVTCLSHLHQIGEATLMYCADNDGVFPSAAASGGPPKSSDWIYWLATTAQAPFNDVRRSALARYLGPAAAVVFRCPSDSCDVRPPNPWGPEMYLYSYSMNVWIGQNATLNLKWLHVHDVLNPSQIILFVDEDDESIDDGAWVPKYLTAHNQISNRHDVNRDTTDPSGNVAFEPTTRGNVVFCDGHGEFVSREFSWTADHFQPTIHPLPAGFY